MVPPVNHLYSIISNKVTYILEESMWSFTTQLAVLDLVGRISGILDAHNVTYVFDSEDGFLALIDHGFGLNCFISYIIIPSNHA